MSGTSISAFPHSLLGAALVAWSSSYLQHIQGKMIITWPDQEILDLDFLVVQVVILVLVHLLNQREVGVRLIKDGFLLQRRSVHLLLSAKKHFRFCSDIIGHWPRERFG
jgi:hypothetical protein